MRTVSMAFGSDRLNLVGQMRHKERVRIDGLRAKKGWIGQEGIRMA